MLQNSENFFRDHSKNFKSLNSNIDDVINKLKTTLSNLESQKEVNNLRITEVKQDLDNLKASIKEVRKWVNKFPIESSKCNFCLEKPVEVISAPCGHKIFCREHGEKFINLMCPMCGQKIQCFIEKIYEI